MRIARFSSGERVGFAVVEGDVESGRAELAVIDAHPFGPLTFTGDRLPLSRAKLLAPVLPSKVVAFAKTYDAHAAEIPGMRPDHPVIFLKPSTSVIGPDDTIVLPQQAHEVDHEAELAIVIGRLCKDVPVERAREVILGYTCVNDVSARDLQRADGQWGRAKGFDTFCPLGPWIETDLDPDNLAITCAVNGEVRQSDRTSSLRYPVAELIAWASASMTLLPGDVVITGSPAGVGRLTGGDVVEVTIESIGTLRNSVTNA